ncbi:VOC family protein [Actinomadura craniellae]|uniref:VOC family protein n=1 Tax=Actinomadura craniellae TaxID=2231787 RepID=A0A365HAT5_9ACTN|nr:VOC family protein [Actinomadura craniellae]
MLIDVTVQDRDASKDFYAGLFGWGFDEELDPTGHYTYAVQDGRIVAGLRPSAPGQPSVWSLYLHTGDTAATKKAVTSAGGQVVHEGEAPGQGKVLVAADPAGAVVGFWQPTIPWSFHSGSPGSLVWSELNVRDAAAADGFYPGLHGYQGEQIGDGQHFDYVVWSLDGPPRLGRMVMGPDFPAEVPPHWLVYIGVDPQIGTDKLAERAVELGGKLAKEPFDIPAGRAALVADVTGATFAIIDESKRTRR